MTFDPRDLTGELIKAARALTNLKVEELASDAMLGVATIKRAEAAGGRVRMTLANADRVMVAFERRGVKFIPEGDEGIGLRVSKVPLKGGEVAKQDFPRSALGGKS